MITAKKSLLLFCFLLVYRGTSQQPKQSHSNIIFFMVDDMGWMDTSDHFIIAPQPASTPTKVSFVTGMNAARTHVTNCTSPNRNVSSDAKDNQF